MAVLPVFWYLLPRSDLLCSLCLVVAAQLCKGSYVQRFPPIPYLFTIAGNFPCFGVGLRER